jgi:hypothetical protein
MRAVEIGIFSVVSLIFLNSVYNLFTDGRLIGGVERSPLALKADTRGPAGSAPAAPGSEGMAGFVPYETKCQPTGETFETTAAKIRILGPFCGAAAPRQPAADTGDTTLVDSGLSSYKVENLTNRYSATVFNDQAAGKFSTDFIPLEPGANRIMMEFRYRSGKVNPVNLTVTRK